MGNYTIEGWIKGKLEYPSEIRSPDEFYFKNHSLFDQFNRVHLKEQGRVKSFRYSDVSTGFAYYVLFAYQEIGLKFTAQISDEEQPDRFEAFSIIVRKAVIAFENFKNYFSYDVSPEKTKVRLINHNSCHLMLNTYGFFRELNCEQQDALVEKCTKFIKSNYSPHVNVINKTKKPQFKSSSSKMKLQTIADLLEEEKYPFFEITVTWGDFYLYVDHYLMRSRYYGLDPSLSVNSVAYGGLWCALVLQDIDKELKSEGKEIIRLRQKINAALRQPFASSVDYYKHELAKIEKKFSITTSEMREFSGLSQKIMDSLESEELRQIHHAIRFIGCLPDSLLPAESILDLNRLQYFSTFKREIIDLRADIKILNLRFSRTEIFSTIALLSVVLGGVSVLIWQGYDIGGAADFLGILTFVIAMFLLVLRVLPKRSGDWSAVSRSRDICKRKINEIQHTEIYSILKYGPKSKRKNSES